MKLYVAVRSELPPDGRVLTRAVPDDRRDQRAAFLDDCIELVIDPNRERSAGDRTYYHIITNGRGAIFDWSVDPDNRQNAMDLTWRLQDWQLAQQQVERWWHIEIAIPGTFLRAHRQGDAADIVFATDEGNRGMPCHAQSC